MALGTPPKKPSRVLAPTACSGEERGGSPGLMVSRVASKDEYLRICQLKNLNSSPGDRFVKHTPMVPEPPEI